MPRFTILILLFTFFTSLISCNSTNKIAGTYRNNFKSSGFERIIKLKEDSTFQFEFYGDLIYDKISGHYHIIDKKLYAYFEKQLADTNTTSNLFNTPIKTFTKSNYQIQYMMSYLIVDHKLFLINIETGKVVRKSSKFNKQRKYFLFGSHYYAKRFYLEKSK